MMSLMHTYTAGMHCIDENKISVALDVGLRP